MITVAHATDLDVVRDMLRTYAESVGLELPFETFQEELQTLDQVYEDLFVASVGERVAGCGALRRIDESNCEMRRLYVRPFLRRQGAGHALVQCLIETARARGYDSLHGELLPTMGEAIRLCETFGFRDGDAFRDPAPAGTRFLRLSLAGDELPVGLMADAPDLSDWEWGEE